MPGSAPRTVHVHVPIRVRVHGVPDDDTVSALARAVRRQVRQRTERADEVLQRSTGRATTPASPGPVVSRPQPSEPYDAARDLAVGYAVPSYDHDGAPVAVPVRRPPVPGRDWRVLRALTVRLSVGAFLDYAEQVMAGAGTTGSGGHLAGREVYADIEAEQRNVTVWLVETEQSTSLPDLVEVVRARAAELLHLRSGTILGHAGSPFDGARQLLAMLDPSGQVRSLPSLARRNARRVSGSGADAQLLHGSWILWAAMELPEILPGTLLDIGVVDQRTVRVDEVAWIVDTAAFASTYQLSWESYVAEAGAHPARLHLMPLRVKGEAALITVQFLARTAYADSGAAPTLGPELAQAGDLYDIDEPGVPAVVERAGRDFVSRLPALTPLPTPRHPADGPRVEAGTVGVIAVAYLPVDAETLGAARMRPEGRRLAVEARRLLAGDIDDRTWKYGAYEWLGGRFTRATGEPRPAGGTVFEYMLADLDASHDLDRLFAGVEESGWYALRLRFALLCAETSYATHPRAVALLRGLQAETLSDRENTYYETVDASNPGGLDLEHDPHSRVTPGVPGRSVLGDVDSVYLTEHAVKTMKPEPAARLRAALERARTDLLADIASGRISRTISSEDFLREALGRALPAARITDDDFEKKTVQRSLRVIEVHRRDISLLPSWDITLQAVERFKGTTEWTPVGQPFSRTADELESDLIFWALGRAGEFYEAIGLGITVIGGIAVAWEAGLVAILVEAAGGATVVLTSIAISELIYLVRVIFFDAELSLEGFLMAAVEGYLGALGFRAGALAAAPIGRAIGTATVRRVWTGIVLEKLVAGAVGGGVTEALDLFAHDLVDVIVHDGEFHAAADYARRIGIGAAMGALGEFTISPVLHQLGARGLTALESAADLVAQLRREGFSLADFAASSAEALANLRRSLGNVVVDDAVREYLAAFRSRVEEALSAWGENVVARRVLELSGAQLTRPATAGLRMFLTASEEPGSQEAARRLATTFAAHPQETVHLLEVLSTMDESVARRLMKGTFGTSADLAAFIGRLGRYTSDQQRGALDLLGRLIDEYGVTSHPAAAGQTAEQVRNAQLAVALRAEARAARIEAERLRREAERLLQAATTAESYNRRRADILLEQAAAAERRAADQEGVSASLDIGVDPRPPGERIPSLSGGAPPGSPDPALDAEVDEVFRQLEAGAGTARQPWIRLTAHKRLNPEETDALVRTVFTSRSGNPVVFRVEGGVGTDASREFTHIGPDGRVRISTGGRALNVNVGTLERAIEFILEARPGARLKVYEVEAGWLRALRGIATPEQGTAAVVNELDPATGAVRGQLPPGGSISDVQGLARTVDTRQAVDQLQISSTLVGELQEFIVPGSGRVIEYVPRPARVRR